MQKIYEVNINLLVGLFVGALTGFDIFFRFDEMAGFTFRGYLIYFLSVVFLFLLIRECYYLLYSQVQSRRFWLYYLLLGLFILIFLFIVSGSYSFYNYFDILPNIFTFEYMYDEFVDFMSMGSSGLTLPFVSGFLVIFAGLLYVISKFIRNSKAGTRIERSAVDVVLSVGLVIGLFFILNNNVRLYPGCSTPFVNTFASFTNATISFMNNREVIRALNQASRVKLEPLNKDLDYNILVIFNESLRGINSNTHGYARDTTPFQTQFIAEHDCVVFDNFYGVSSKTKLALPTFFTGIHPMQPGYELFNAPIYSNFMKMFNNVDTLVISAHPFHWGNFGEFLDDGSWDVFRHMENSGVEYKNAQCIDDKYLVERFGKYVAGKDEAHAFFGIVHFKGTHQPYFSDEEDRIFRSSDIYDVYDNSIRTLDKHTRKLIEILQQNNLLDNTIIIFTSDHAEALGEHGYRGHLHTYYEEEAKVPTWMYIPEKLRNKYPQLEEKYAAAIGNEAVNLSNVDLMPTILDIAGLWDNKNIAGVQGKYLGEPITQPLDPARLIYFQNNNEVSDKNMFIGVGMKFHDYKYLLHSKYGRLVEEVYDIGKDPQEKDNIIKMVDKELLDMFHGELLKYKSMKVIYDKYLAQQG